MVRAVSAWFVVLGMTLSFGAGSVFAEPSGPAIAVAVDRAKVFQLQEDAGTIIIGNPAIADVTLQDRKTLILTGKSFGTTNLVILDHNSHPLIDQTIVVQPSTTDIVTVTRKNSRSSYSCTPDCEPTIRLGDSDAAFNAASAQATAHSSLATGSSAAAPR